MFAFDTSLTADAKQVETEAVHAVTQNKEIAQDPAPFIRIASVDSGNDVLSWHLFYWAAPTKAAEIKTVSETLAQIKSALYDAGVPTPTATSATILQRSQLTQKEGHPLRNGQDSFPANLPG